MIRKVKSQEYPVLVEIWESAVIHTHDFLAREDFEYFKKTIPSYFEFVELYVHLNQEGRMTGFIGVADGNLEMLFIHNDFRGQGIGKLLLNYAKDRLHITKVDVNEQNHQAVGFYLHMGFKSVSRSETDGQGKPYPILHLSL
ncbi:acetyltransferase [Myroides profundi]|uniref:Acetyltransferase n=1 Tax=Myroides profundi TaxID=480520 RepID=A0AAJ5BEL1_MYRPR|nr:acetyltransferase [Myroides profundi]AJH14401.1 putative acetyltransferase [Myroides profundi]SER18236.1 putative acetyltransferase [Myroides profundi]